MRALQSIALCAVCLGALLGRPAAVLAQTPAQRAEALFKEGRKLFDDHKYEEACPKLAESDSIDPNINALGLLAACHEEQGRIATAWREYLETAKRAKAAGDKREGFARERAQALEPKVPRVTLRVQQPEADLSITRNGTPVPDSEIGGEVPVDPGTIEVVATAPGKVPWRASVTIAPGARQTIDIPALTADDKANPFVPPEPSGGGTPALRIAGFIAGGVGVVGLGVGAGFGLAAISKNNESTENGACNEQSQCNATGQAAREDARSLAMGSNIGFGIGIAGVGAGIVLLVLSSGGETPEPEAGAQSSSLWIAPAAGPGGAGAIVRGTF